MAATDLGTAHIFGIGAGVGAVTDATVLSFKSDGEFANKAETHNEVGNVIERRSDDLTTKGSITMRIRAGYTPIVPGAIFTYQTTKYEVTKVGRAEAAKDFVVITLDFITSAYVTLV